MPPKEILCHLEHDKCSDKSCNKEHGELYFALAFSKPMCGRGLPHRSSAECLQKHCCAVHTGIPPGEA